MIERLTDGSTPGQIGVQELGKCGRYFIRWRAGPAHDLIGMLKQGFGVLNTVAVAEHHHHHSLVERLEDIEPELTVHRNGLVVLREPYIVAVGMSGYVKHPRIPLRARAGRRQWVGFQRSAHLTSFTVMTKAMANAISSSR